MNALGAYLIAQTLEGTRRQEPSYPADDPQGDPREPRPGIGARVRKLFGRRRVVNEPGFAATHTMLSDFVPALRAYPYPPTYR